jgi:hypothetical protein
MILAKKQAFTLSTLTYCKTTCGRSVMSILFLLSSHIFKNGDMDLSLGGTVDVANPLPNVAKLVDAGNGDEDEDDESANRFHSHFTHFIGKRKIVFNIKKICLIRK